MRGATGLFPVLEGNGWPPGVDSFDARPLFPGAGVDWLSNNTAQAVISVFIVLVAWWIVARKHTIVPGKRQFAGEFLYDMIRNGLAREIIGPEFHRFVPYLVALFSFILVNNWFGEFFPFMFPTFSKIGYVYALALMSWLLYNGVGIARYGPLGYLKNATLPEGVPPALWIIIIPLEFLSNIIVRPLTLCLRLFANMFAGHLLTLVFVLGGTILLESGIPLAFAGVGSFAMAFLILPLELFIGALQAYIFTLLTAQYVSAALSEGH